MPGETHKPAKDNHQVQPYASSTPLGMREAATPLSTFLGAGIVVSEDVIGASQFSGYPPRIFSTAPRTSLFKFNFTPAILTVHYPGTNPDRYSANLRPPSGLPPHRNSRTGQRLPSDGNKRWVGPEASFFTLKTPVNGVDDSALPINHVVLYQNDLHLIGSFLLWGVNVN